MKTEEQFDIATSLRAVDASAWDALAGNQPFVRHAFLLALEQTGCVGGDTGWLPHHLLLLRAGQLVGALPLYLRHDSTGEFVFDFAWADAYARYGGHYYPKLLSAIPFTPVTGRRLLANNDADRLLLIDGALDLARQLQVSSWHCLFPTAEDAALLATKGLMQRFGAQFHWRNAGYARFDDYLAEMSHDKRKKIKQERRKLVEQGIHFERTEGMEISEADWTFFNHCYQITYRQHHSSPYLNLDFFLRLGRDLPDHIVMFKAIADGKPIAAALNLKNSGRLFGRYWGAPAYVPGLHFETCYYQGIAYCIEQGIEVFEGGVQGEHKLARGLIPIKTYSNHWLAHPQFSAAIADYLARESLGTQRYMEELNEMTPFKNTQP